MIRIAINAVTINAMVLVEERKLATPASNVIRISSTASIPPTLKTAKVGLTCS